MGIIRGKIPEHWNYYLCIEDDILALSRCIELVEDNFECYSIELARILMIASAEVDVVAKLLCRDVSATSTASSIGAYQDALMLRYPKLHKAKVTAPRFGLTLTPWANWSEPRTSPFWWQANNKVKHHRSEHFRQATLKNALNSVAALLLFLVLYYGSRLPSIAPAPRLFKPGSFAYLDGDYVVYCEGLG